MDLVRLLQTTSCLALCVFASALLAAAQPASEIPASPASQAASPAVNSSSEVFEGRLIASVTFDPADQPVEENTLTALIAIRPGQPFHANEARTAIERLYATGRYQDIQLDAEPAATGVALRFITKNSWFFGHIQIANSVTEPPSVGQILSTAGLALGTPFDEAAVADAETRISTLLTANGYFDSHVTHEFSYGDHQQVGVTFTLKTGPRAHYTQPDITGDTTVLSAQTITKATGWHRFLMPGFRGITQTRTRNGIDNIRLRYQKDNHLLATVTFSGITPITGKGEKVRQGTAKIQVNPGPVVNVTSTGAKEISRHVLTQTVPIYEEGTVDADLLTEGAGNLRDYLQQKGYFEASVDFREQQINSGHTEIQYDVQPGPQHRLVAIVIKGNKFFDEKTLRERMFLLPKSFEFRHGRFSEALAARDRTAIEDLYRANGFADVHVTSQTEDDYRGIKSDIASFFAIDEGPQYRVTSLVITGTGKLDLTKTKQQLSSQQGQIFSAANVAADREMILNQYTAAGYADAAFEWTQKPGPDPHTVDLTFKINEGTAQFIRDVLVTGYSTTRRSLINEQMVVHADDPLSSTTMAETQRKLYDLGIFSQVNMAVQNEDGSEVRRFVLFDLQEASRYSLTVGVGTQFGRLGSGSPVADLSNPAGSATLSPHISLSLSRLNLFGRAQSVSLQIRLSTLQKRGTVSYFVPRIFSRPTLDGEFTILYDDTDDINTFHAVRKEVSAQISQKASKTLTLFYRFSYRDVGVSDLKISPLLQPRLTQTVRVGIPSFNLVHDRRDDPTDPHRGIYSTLDVGVSSKIFGSHNSFVRALGRNATYHRIGAKLVLARETQFGIERPFSIPADADPTDPIPFPERFYGGGGNTHRGFPQNQAGPRDGETGFPLGGSALFFNSTELRFPLWGANIGGVLFEDMGNVFAKIGDMSFRFHQKDATDFNYTEHAVGFGIRYRTPLGPLRGDLAYSINPPKYNGFPGNYSQLIECSQNNTCVSSPQQISHFQFFFSIGQAF